MLFNSYIFICILLPISLIGWYALNHFGHTRLAGVFLCGMSLWFYGYFHLSYLLIIIASIIINYIISIIVMFMSDDGGSVRGLSDMVLGQAQAEHFSGEEMGSSKILPGTYGTLEPAARRVLLVISVCINLGILFYFKYTDFFIENVNVIAGTDFALKHIMLPLGISFFTFQQLSFVIDRCLGKAPHYDFINYAVFVTFYPQLIAGPIVTWKEMIPQFEDISKRRPDRENIRIGIRYFVMGFAKKVLLADILAGPVNYAFTRPRELDSLTVLFVMLMYMFELYFDFSGYCDMASGIAKMFNIDLPINFNSPYLSATVKELWQRWHITLSRFFTEYVYIPLGGSRKGRARALVNVFIVFLLSGLWHGAAWTYVLWGAINGALVVWDNLKIIGVRGKDDSGSGADRYRNMNSRGEGTYAVPSGDSEYKLYIPYKIGQFFTFNFFLLTLCFFRSSSIPEAGYLIKTLFTFKWNGGLFDILSHLEAPEFYMIYEAARMMSDRLPNIAHLICSVEMLLISLVVITRPNSHAIAPKNDHPVRDGVLMGILFVWCFVSLSQVSTFLYFNF